MTGEREPYTKTPEQFFDVELPIEGGWFGEAEKKEPEVDNTPEFLSEDEEFEYALDKIWDIAEEHHLDPFPTTFDMAPAKIVNQIAAYNIPNRFSHWTFGRNFRVQRTQYEHGMGKIYELVINSNPSQAYLMENNAPIDNKLVMAHVLGHTDFFKNNKLFESTKRDMPSRAARSAERIHSYEKSEGMLEVEKFLDAVLALEEYSDPYNPDRPYRDEEIEQWTQTAQRKLDLENRPVESEFDDIFAIGAVKKVVENRRKKATITIPPEPDSDILGFLRNHAPYLEDWQQDIIDVIRSESDYFFPQKRTKIMNEGWAAYWHKRIMREMGSRGYITQAEDEAWADLHSRIVAESQRQLNPYHLGMKMYEYLEDYYNGNLSQKERDWLIKQGKPVYPKYEGELKDSPATEALRDIMMHNDDQSFIRNYFDKNIADRLHMYVYEEKAGFMGNTYKVVKSNGWMDVRSQLVNMLDNNGTPRIAVIESDYSKAGELYLRHEYDGRQLDMGYIQKTLPYVYQIWQRTVHLETFDSSTDQKVVFKYNGNSVVTYHKP